MACSHTYIGTEAIFKFVVKGEAKYTRFNRRAKSKGTPSQGFMDKSRVAAGGEELPVFHMDGERALA